MSDLYLYKLGLHKASWALSKRNYFLQSLRFLLKSKSHWGRGGLWAWASLVLHTTWKTLPSSLKAGLSIRRLANLHSFALASLLLFC